MHGLWWKKAVSPSGTFQWIHKCVSLKVNDVTKWSIRTEAASLGRIPGNRFCCPPHKPTFGTNVYHLGCFSQFHSLRTAQPFRLHLCPAGSTLRGTSFIHGSCGSSGAKHFGVKPCRPNHTRPALVPTVPLSEAPVCSLRDPRVPREERGPKLVGCACFGGAVGRVASLSLSLQ